MPWYDSGADSASIGSSCSSRMYIEQSSKCLNPKSDPGRILCHTILKPVSNQMHSFCVSTLIKYFSYKTYIINKTKINNFFVLRFIHILK